MKFSFSSGIDIPGKECDGGNVSCCSVRKLYSWLDYMDVWTWLCGSDGHIRFARWLSATV